MLQLYIKQQTGLLKKPMAGVLTNLKTNINVNEKEFNENILETEINNFRERNNLKRLTRYDPLCNLAKLRVQEIKTDWSHKGFEERNEEIYTKYCNKGALVCTLAGENLAKGDFLNEVEVVKGWENSQGHKENMMGAYNVQCVAVSGKYYVSLFANTTDINYIKQQQEKELNSNITYDYEKVIFWENQKEINTQYLNNWKRGYENPHYKKEDLENLIKIFKDKIDITNTIWDGITNAKITNQEALDLENKYWELANKGAKISNELNEDAYKTCLEQGVKKDLCKGYKNN